MHTVPFYTHILNIWFGLVEFYGISTFTGYLMPNPLYTKILNIYDLVWLSFMAYQPLQVILCQILFIHIYYIYMICEYKSTNQNTSILLCSINNLIKHQLFVYTQLNDETVLFLTIQFGISHMFALSSNVK